MSHISIEHQKLMARIVIQWAKLEGALHDLIWSLVELNEDEGRVLTKHLDAKMLIPIARALGAMHFPKEAFIELKTALKNADGLREDRNFIVHGVWGTLMPENTPHALSMRLKSPLGSVLAENFPVERMKLILELCRRTKDTIFTLREAYVASLDKPSSSACPD